MWWTGLLYEFDVYLSSLFLFETSLEIHPIQAAYSYEVFEQVVMEGSYFFTEEHGFIESMFFSLCVFWSIIYKCIILIMGIVLKVKSVKLVVYIYLGLLYKIVKYLILLAISTIFRCL